MAITWNSVGHFFASCFHDLVVGARAVAAHNAQIQQAGTVAENVTSEIAVFYPPAVAAVEIERVAMACLGEFAALIQANGTAAKAAKAQPDADPGLLVQVEALLAKNPLYVQQAAALFKIPSAGT